MVETEQNGDALAQQVRLVAPNARSLTSPNTAHWVMEENPRATTDGLASFLTGPVSIHTYLLLFSVEHTIV